MACPSCGCKVHYQYEGGGGFDGVGAWPEELERCAACGHVFNIEDQAPEDEEEEHGQAL